MALAPSITEESDLSDDSRARQPKSRIDAESSLINSLREGDDRAYESLVRIYGPQVLSVARRYLRSEADAADCFQETFLAIFQGIEKFEQRSSLRHWIRGVTINHCLMRIRKSQRLRENSIDHMLPVFDERGGRVEIAGPRDITAIGDSLDKQQRRKLVREHINKLPQDFRVVLLLRDIDGYTTREAATILGISTSALKTRLHRARSALKFRLEPIMEQTNCHADL